jgi:Na+/melibiose symporter-like transporter
LATPWHSVGFSEADSFTTAVVTSIVNVPVTLVAIALVDKIGRKPLLTVGSAGMAITPGAMTWCSSQATGSGTGLVLPGSVGMVALVAAKACVVFSASAGARWSGCCRGECSPITSAPPHWP